MKILLKSFFEPANERTIYKINPHQKYFGKCICQQILANGSPILIYSFLLFLSTRVRVPSRFRRTARWLYPRSAITINQNRTGQYLILVRGEETGIEREEGKSSATGWDRRAVKIERTSDNGCSTEVDRYIINLLAISPRGGCQPERCCRRGVKYMARGLGGRQLDQTPGVNIINLETLLLGVSLLWLLALPLTDSAIYEELQTLGTTPDRFYFSKFKYAALERKKKKWGKEPDSVVSVVVVVVVNIYFCANCGGSNIPLFN